MKTATPKLLLTSSPFLKLQEDTPLMMRQVIYALLPAALAGVYYFGVSALLVMATCIGGAMLTEYAVSRSKTSPVNPLYDGSAFLTGLLLAMVLPPGIPLWMAFIGAAVSILMGKALFGGIGANIFNPALVGRAFLQASFPVAITTWTPAGNLSRFWELQGNSFSIPFLKSTADAMTAATPLAQAKFVGEVAAFKDLLLGNTAGSLGETSALLLILGGLYLLRKNVINWRIPLGVFIAVIISAGLIHWMNPEKFAPPLFHLFSGGLMLGAIYMATDPVTSPITHRGCWIFGAGVGLLVVIIRNFGGLPEGVMYAILLMNAVSPLISRMTQPRIYGEIKEKPKKTPAAS